MVIRVACFPADSIEVTQKLLVEFFCPFPQFCLTKALWGIEGDGQFNKYHNVDINVDHIWPGSCNH